MARPRTVARAGLAAGACLALAGCWGVVSDVDLVGEAKTPSPVLADGVYCPVQIWGDIVEIDYGDCDRIGWDAREARHYYAPAQIRWDEGLGMPRAAPSLAGFGATSVWLDVADLGRGLAIVQRLTADGSAFEEALTLPGRYVAFVVCADQGGFAVLPAASNAMLDALAPTKGVELAPFELEGVEGRRIVAGEGAAARAVAAEAAGAWLIARMQAGGDFRQRPAERADVGPLYHVRIDALDPGAPLTVGVESAMFRIEQRLRSLAVEP